MGNSRLVSYFQLKNKWWCQIPFRVSWFLFTTKTNRWRAWGLTSPNCGCSSMVEFLPSKQIVVGSSPITRFRITEIYPNLYLV